MVEILTFDKAIQRSENSKKRHILLGNGFSIACRPDIFAYTSLFEKADFSSNPTLQKVFEAARITDFECIIKILQDMSRIIPVYLPKLPKVTKQMELDAESLKNILIETVAKTHPSTPQDISNEEFQSCRKFLSYFLGDKKRKGKVYTLNYDLLLYWTLMHDDMEPKNGIDLVANDGFGRDKNTKPEYVNWMGEDHSKEQRIHYLHGALHLFDDGDELQKYTWVNTQEALLKQAKEAMSKNKFPLFVAEGESKKKLAKIKHSAYLYHSYKSFSAQMAQADDALFIFDHSLSENDEHILKKIAQGQIQQIYVGLYGDHTSKKNKQIQKAALNLRDLRKKEDKCFVLEVAFFDAGSARVWDNSTASNKKSILSDPNT